MEKFIEVFKKERVVLPVVHVKDLHQAKVNVEIAKRAGADGAFLINHGSVPWHEFLDIQRWVSSMVVDFWMGINCLDLRPFDLFNVTAFLRPWLKVPGIWTDNAFIDENAKQQIEPERIKGLIGKNKWEGLYFGGVAFKYQREVEELEKAAKIAARYMDVVTTSGPATGEAADLAKIRRIREAIPGKPMAIASGITPENVGNYLDFSPIAFLVSTGINNDFYNLNEEKTARLVERVI